MIVNVQEYMVYYLGPLNDLSSPKNQHPLVAQNTGSNYPYPKLDQSKYRS